VEHKMKEKGENKKTSLWNNFSVKQKATIIIFFLVIIVPFFLINGGLSFSNWLFHIINWDINAFGLGNTEWFAFWGTYFGGITTVIAVWWTVTQTERHYDQTSKEQKRQNELITTEQEKQRRSDVLPLILLQPRVTIQSSELAILLGETEEKAKEKRIYVDQLKPYYEEYDISELTILFGEKFEIRVGNLSDEEMRMVKNKGHEDVTNGPVKYLVIPNITYLHPFWLINIGKETAINLRIGLYADDNELAHFKNVFSLMPKTQVKLNFLVNIKEKDLQPICGKYNLQIWYNDLYSNLYTQKFPITIDTQANWTIELDIKQVLEV
jgi:hypothetical protein